MNTELKRPSIEKEDLPITDYIESQEWIAREYDNIITYILPQVKALEEEQQTKLHYLETTSDSIEKGWDESITQAKEEERNRIVGILDEMKEWYKWNDWNWNASFILQEVKERILSTN